MIERDHRFTGRVGGSRLSLQTDQRAEKSDSLPERQGFQPWDELRRNAEESLRPFRRLDGGEPSPGARVGIDRRSFPPPSSPPSGPAAGIVLGLVVSLPLWLIVLIFLGAL